MTALLRSERPIPPRATDTRPSFGGVESYEFQYAVARLASGFGALGLNSGSGILV